MEQCSIVIISDMSQPMIRSTAASHIKLLHQNETRFFLRFNQIKSQQSLKNSFPSS